MSEGQVAVMETSLEKAYNVLQQRVSEELKGVEQRCPQVNAAPGPSGPTPPADQGAEPAPASSRGTPLPGPAKQPDAGQMPAAETN
jgi:hypothetical protein